MERVELHLHTDMSENDGIASIKEYMKKAKELDMPAIAITDNGVVQAFPEAQFLQNYLDRFDYDKVKVLYGLETNLKINEGVIHKATILAKNQEGVKNLYKLVSYSYLKYYDKQPIIPYDVYKQHSDGLIIGACFNGGELYRAVKNNFSSMYEIASKYDYLEICPNDKHIAGKIVEIGMIINKPVVATGNVYYLEQEDKLYSNILSSVSGKSVSENTLLNYFRTTNEMLKEFDYLGEETAYEVVVTNTNKIANMCEKIQPIPVEKCYPHIKDDKTIIKELAYKGAYKIYGDILPKEVEDRLNKELKSIIENDYATLYIIAQRLVKKANKDGYIVGNRGAVGASLVAYCLGITETDPIKYDIPFEVFAGFNGWKEPDIDLNFAYEYQKTAQEYVKDILEGVTTFKGGTVGTLAEKTAYEYVKKYFNYEIDDSTTEQMANKLVGNKRTTGHHPRRSYCCSKSVNSKF